MEQIFRVDDYPSLNQVNKALQEGGTVKMIVAAGAGESGHAEAYVVVAFPPKAQQ